MFEAKGAVHERLRDTLIRIAREPLGLLPLSDIRDEAKADQMLIALRKRNPYMGNLFKEWRQRFSKPDRDSDEPAPGPSQAAPSTKLSNSSGSSSDSESELPGGSGSDPDVSDSDSEELLAELIEEANLPLPESCAAAVDSRTLEDKKDFHDSQVNLASVIVERMEMVLNAKLATASALAPGSGHFLKERRILYPYSKLQYSL